MVRCSTCFLVLFSVCSSVAAQDSKSDESRAGEVEVHFANGSVLRMRLASEKIEVVTRYGKLEVPLKEIKVIEFGLHMPQGYAPRIDQLVQELGEADYAARAASEKKLVAMGHYALPALRKASQSKQLEVANRAQSALKKIQERTSPKLLKLKDEDRIVTQSFTIMGTIATPTVKAHTELFGDVELPLAKMLTLRSLYASGEIEIALDASRYANPDSWLETEYYHDGRGSIVLTASGQVDLWPATPGQYMTTSKGYMIGQMMWGGGGMTDARRYPGMLLGKIGPTGALFTIGERYEGSPAGEGKLYLHIGPSPWNNACSGTYQVRIMTRE